MHIRKIFFFVLLLSLLVINSVKAQSTAKIIVGLDWLFHADRCEKLGMPEFTWKLDVGNNIGDRLTYRYDCLKSFGDDVDDWRGEFMPSLAPNKDRGKGWFWSVPSPIWMDFNGDINYQAPYKTNLPPGHIPLYIYECFENDKGSRCNRDKKDGCWYQNPSGMYETQSIDINKIVPFQWANNKDYFFDNNKLGASFDIYWEPEALSLNKPEMNVKDTLYDVIYKNYYVQSGARGCGGDTILLECSKAYGDAEFNPVRYHWYVQCLTDPDYTTQTLFLITDDNKAKFKTPNNITATRQYRFWVIPYYEFANRFSNDYSNVQVIPVGPARPTIDSDAIALTNPTCYKYNDGTLKIDFSKIHTLANPKSFNYNLASDQPEYGSSSPASGTTTNYTFNNLSVNYTLTNPNSYFTTMPYTLQVLNTDGECGTILRNIKITQPDRLQIDTTVGVYNNSNVSCYDSTDGRVTVLANGGTRPYQFYINEFPLGDQLALSDSTARNFMFTRLKPDTRYDFHVTDAHNCVAYTNFSPFDTAKVQNVYLTKPSPIHDTVYAREYLKELHQKPHNVSCYHYDNAELYAQIIRDSTELLNPPYRIWVQDRTDYGSTPFGADFNTPVYLTPAGRLKKGFYTIQIRDANNCPHTDTITLYEPDKLVLTKTDSSMIKCYEKPDGSVLLYATGGTKNYEFFKDTFNNGYPPATSPVQSILSDSTALYTRLISGPPQYHIFYVSDANGCIDSVRFNLPEPAPLEVSLEVSNIICHNEQNGMLTAEVKGGTGAYTYEWSDGALIAGEASPRLDSLGPRYYAVTVKDINHCQASAHYTLVNPQPIAASVYEHSPLSCADKSDASISIDSIQGGWQGFRYTKDGVHYTTEPFFTNLSAGVYDRLAILDANGCLKRLDTVRILKPKALTATIEENNGINCYGNSDAEVLLKITEGKKPYSIQLNGQTKTGSDSLYRFTGLAAGAHILSVSDGHNCSFVKEITVLSPAKLQDTILHITEATNGANDGAATISAVGGTAPYNYTWLLPAQAPPNHQKSIRSEYDPITVGNLYADLYQVLLTDAKGCAHTAYVGVSNVQGPTIDTIVVTNPLCSYTTDGRAMVEASTPNLPLSYYWPGPNISSNSIDQLAGGSYDVKITDALGNITTRRVYVNAPTPLEVTMITYPSTCNGQCEGIIEANLSGGTQPYTYLWNDPQAQSTYRATQLCEGLYQVAISDAHNCTTAASTRLINPAKVAPTLGGKATICYGQVMTLDAGYEGSSYFWTSSFGFVASSQSIQTSLPGTYYLAVVDPFGCTGRDTFLLETSSSILHAEFVEPTKNYVGETVVFSEISWPRPESVEWILGSPDSVQVIGQTHFLKKVIYHYPGTYTVRMIASLGECRDTMDKIIKIFAPDDFQGYSDGRISISSIEELLLYPNPNAGKFTASVKLNNALPITITVYDVYGTLIKEMTREGATQYDVGIELNQLAAGIYSLRASTEEDTRSVLFTIQY